MRRNLIILLLLAGAQIAAAWTNGQLLIWMDADRASAIQLVADEFEKHFGIPVRIETPVKRTTRIASAPTEQLAPGLQNPFVVAQESRDRNRLWWRKREV